MIRDLDTKYARFFPGGRNLKTVQVNLGKLCNLACHHCHVGAGPNKKRENMAAATADRIVRVLGATAGIETLDLTGGAPEMNPFFRQLVEAGRALGLEVIDRSNLTVLRLPEQATTRQFLIDNQVTIVASLPCYLEDNVDRQRGDGVFWESVAVLQELNRHGYGRDESGLKLHLVFNPQGTELPPDQNGLTMAYKKELRRRFDIVFNDLYCITNMPIKRFRADLQRHGQLTAYEQKLADHFNPEAAGASMCRSLISISWDGRIFDCDFNQALDMPVVSDDKTPTIWDVDDFNAVGGPIQLGSHCLACSAGSGSSCFGESKS